MKNYSINKRKFTYLERLKLQMGTRQLKARLKPTIRYQLQLAKSKYNLSSA